MRFFFDFTRKDQLFAEVGDGVKGEAAYRGGVRASTSPSKEHYAIVPHDNVVNLIYAGL